MNYWQFIFVPFVFYDRFFCLNKLIGIVYISFFNKSKNQQMKIKKTSVDSNIDKITDYSLFFIFNHCFFSVFFFCTIDIIRNLSF